jgi:hypothetical protein
MWSRTRELLAAFKPTVEAVLGWVIEGEGEVNTLGETRHFVGGRFRALCDASAMPALPESD